MDDTKNMSIESLNNTAQTDPINTTKVEPYEYGVADGTALIEEREKEINEATQKLQTENAEMLGIEDEESFGQKVKNLLTSKKFLVGAGTASVALGIILSQSGCSGAPVSSVALAPESYMATSVAATLQSNENVMPIEEATATPLVESTSATEPAAIEEEKYLDTDFSITPEIWRKIYGRDITEEITGIMYKTDEFNYQYQLWIEGQRDNNIPYFVSTFPYVADSEDQNMILKMKNAVEKLDLENKSNTEEQVTEQALECGYYMDSQYLDENMQDIQATVIYITIENGKVIPHSFSNGGIVFYINDGEVQHFNGNRIPTDLPQEVKEKFLQKYSRVDVNDGVVEASGKWEW
ncbi:hypothetical protein GYA44_01520 [Candidatus Microgenomates bacterium]|nr:hypothetical protein [Candidatus Microgenomates bacterium]